MSIAKNTLDATTVRDILKQGSRGIAPLWSLENFVAVNPFLGMADKTFEQVMDFLHRTSDAQATLPIEFYLKALEHGELTKEDVKRALQSNTLGILGDAAAFIEELYSERKPRPEDRIRTMSDVASEINGKNWRRFMVDRISFWASAYFDRNQAIWNTADRSANLYAAWKREAEVDYATEAMGLKGFRAWVRTLPEDHLEAAARVLNELEIPESTMDHYLNALLMKMNGWAGFAVRVDWDAGLAGQESDCLQQFLSVMLVWELAFMKLLPYPNLPQGWQEAIADNLSLASSETVDHRLASQLILQKAFDLSKQRSLIRQINDQSTKPKAGTETRVQAVFCIDVRSEVFRRNLEAAGEGIDTLGFAGFFGFPIRQVPLGHEHGTEQCPVLISTSHVVRESLDDPIHEKEAIERRHLSERFLKVWNSFRSGAVSCFGFVSPLGLYYLPKLFSDALGLTRPVAHPNEAGLRPEEARKKSMTLEGDARLGILGIPREDRLNMAKTVLTAMSLTDSFAPIVLIAGHGANTANNPHATGLDCGACGGHTGEANAKVAAAVLNDPEVREGLRESGIVVPEDTLFVAGLHDTTTDRLSLFGTFDRCTDAQKQRLQELKQALNLAGELSRKERAARMKIPEDQVDKLVLKRSRDWSQVRPEWGLAGCSSFIVAPRRRTAALNLGGKAFMHSYEWERDQNFGVLELIMTAPMVVTSWINLQYYASTVDNKRFGAGNKALHNVVGGMGVLEGFAGDLRVGLPWQSVHDGEEFQHEPNRLNVFIEAPVDAMSRILEKHQGVRDLCDNEWIYLFAIDDHGMVTYRYAGNLEWELV